MAKGTIAKLVRTHGSAWGRICPEGTTRTVFFNPASLAAETHFAGLEEGQHVRFDEERDHVNGSLAIQVAVAELSS